MQGLRGCREAVEDGVTGILIPRGDVDALQKAITFVIKYEEQSRKMGENGRIKVGLEFDEKYIFDRIKKEYGRLINERCAKQKNIISMHNPVLKRIFDIVISLAGLIVLSPVFLLISILVALDSRGPVFFTQERIGKYGKPFYPLKFRTMVVGAQNTGLGVASGVNDNRITRVGTFLRKWGIDEFPQLVNILKGEMSVVGPRPTLRYQVEKYDEFQKRRLLAKPGLAGWAKVHGRNSLTWEERIRYDVWYVDNWSLWLDIKILFLTCYLIFIKQEGEFGKTGFNDDPFINKK